MGLLWHVLKNSNIVMETRRRVGRIRAKLGHTLRKSRDHITWNPQDKRKRGGGGGDQKHLVPLS